MLYAARLNLKTGATRFLVVEADDVTHAIEIVGMCAEYDTIQFQPLSDVLTEDFDGVAELTTFF